MAQTYRAAIRCELLRGKVFAGERTPPVLRRSRALDAAADRGAARARFRPDRGGGGTARCRASNRRPPPRAARRRANSPGSPMPIRASGRCWRRWSTANTTGCRSTGWRALDIEKPEDLRDQVWMPARFVWTNGGESVGFIPTRYPGSEARRRTRRWRWRGAPSGEERGSWFLGLGQRMLRDRRGRVRADGRRGASNSAPSRREPETMADLNSPRAAAALAARPADRRRARHEAGDVRAADAGLAAASPGGAARSRVAAQHHQPGARWRISTRRRSPPTSTVNYGIPGFAGLVGTTDRIGDARDRHRGRDPYLRAAHPSRHAGGAGARDDGGQAHARDRCSRSAANSGRSRCRSSCSWRRRSTWKPGSPRSPMRGRLADGPAPAAPLRGGARLHPRDGRRVRRANSPRSPPGSNLGSLEVADPYVERLLEGFAFLAARVQLKLEAEFPTFTQSLLQLVYPHYLAPTPAMAVVQFRSEATLRGDAAGHGAAARHRTAQPARHGGPDQLRIPHRQAVQLLPIELADAEYIGSPAALAALGLPEQRGVKAAIRLRLRATGEAPFAKIDARAASSSSSAAPRTRGCGSTSNSSPTSPRSYVRPTERPLPWQERLPKSVLRGVGFEADEALLPQAPESLRGVSAAAGILRHAGTVPVRRTGRAGPGGRALRRARA